MESVKYICPTCDIGLSTSHCPTCDHDLNEDILLVNLVQSEYNRALAQAKNKNYLEAWTVMRDSLGIYPYLPVPIGFAYYLAIQVGEYQYAYECLNRLNSVSTDQEFHREYQYLKNQVNIYNEIVQDNVLKSSTSHNLSLIHYYLLHLLSGEKQQKKNYLNVLARFDSSFSDVLKFGSPSLKPWKCAVFVLSIMVFVLLSLIFFMLKNTNREVCGMKNQPNTIYNRNDSLNTVLFIFSDSLSRLEDENMLYQRK